MYKKNLISETEIPLKKGGAPETSNRLMHERKCRENLISETEIPLKDGRST